ncbi:MAG: RHS repeat-associated core domain-containing protein [Hyphomonadaceae bacterium]|nr:RHS repeat-associated core domain-containing protein [Hyphomonadaceae bacterium]
MSDRRWLHADRLGSVIAVSDASGAALAINAYDEYGAPSSSNAGRFQYTGQMWLPEAGLYHYKARAYAPSLGRFLQSDPILHAGGMNLYAYVGGDPVNARDPWGLFGAPHPDGGGGKPNELPVIITGNRRTYTPPGVYGNAASLLRGGGGLGRAVSGGDSDGGATADVEV